MIETSFEDSPWQQYLKEKAAGETVCAARLLTALEGEEEDAVEDCMDMLEELHLILSVENLPRTVGFGEMAVRLRQEMQMVSGQLTADSLEENDPLRLYLEEIAGTPVWGDEGLLSERCAGGDEDAMVALTNLGLSRVVELAREHVGYGVLLLDLIQEGSLGLWQAVRNYREGDYALWRDYYIRLYMARAIVLQARDSGVGQKLRSAMEDFRQVDERLLSELGRNPTLEEIAQQLHMAPEQAAAVQKVLNDAAILAKVKAPAQEEEQEEEQAVEDTAAFRSRARVLDLLSGLDETDAKILSARFGLNGGKPLSQAEAGKLLGLTPQEVSQREIAALAILRTK